MKSILCPSLEITRTRGCFHWNHVPSFLHIIAFWLCSSISFCVSQICPYYCLRKSTHIKIYPRLLIFFCSPLLTSFAFLLGSSFFFPKYSPQWFFSDGLWMVHSQLFSKNTFIWLCSCMTVDQGIKSRLTVIFPSPFCRC